MVKLTYHTGAVTITLRREHRKIVELLLNSGKWFLTRLEAA